MEVRINGTLNATTEKRVRKEFSLKERHKLEVCLKQKLKLSEIGLLLGFHVKTIRREISRGTVTQRDSYLRDYECYKAEYAQVIQDDSVKRRCRKPKIIADELKVHIRTKLRNKYSPNAIIGEIRRDNLFNDTPCTKTLYNWLYKGYIAGFEMSKRRRVIRQRTVGLKNPTGKRITDRPVEADDRHPGHWELVAKVGPLVFLYLQSGTVAQS